MRIRRTEPGQIIPIVALLMVAIMGMAAFAIDGSNIYSQHRRYQADLDVAIKVAAAKMFDFNPSDAAYTSTAQTAIQDAAQLLAQDGYPNRIATAVYPSAAMTLTGQGAGLCGIDAGITICTPPLSGPFSGRLDFVEGFLKRDVRGFFGGVLGLGRVGISVRAVAEHGGASQPFAVIGLDSTSLICAISVQDKSSNLTTYGSIHSNSETCVNDGTANIYGLSESVEATNVSNGQPITGTLGTTNGGAAPITNPYSVTVPTPLTDTAITICTALTGTCTYSDFSHLDNACYQNYWKTGLLPAPSGSLVDGVTYYLPPDSPSAFPPYGHTALVTNFNAPNGEFDFLPHCDSQVPISQTAAIYYFTGNPQDIQTSGQGTINSYNSAFVLDPTASTLIKTTGTSLSMWRLNAPSNGPLQGMAIWEDQPCNTSTFPQAMDLAGSSNSLINGIVDVACANVNVTGNVTDNPFINGVLVGWQVTVSGGGTAIVNYNPSGTPPDKGSVLTQ